MGTLKQYSITKRLVCFGLLFMIPFLITQVKKSEEKNKKATKERIVELIGHDPTISAERIAKIIGISSRAVEKQLASLKKGGYIVRIGPAKGGIWEFLK
jgi:ATP-dependent DNA helicase RecG